MRYVKIGPYRGEPMRGTKIPANVQGEKVAALPSRPREETARLGKEIYERDILGQVEGTCHGMIVAIDVDSGDYAIGDMAVTAAEQLRERRPDADIWGVRVGYRGLCHFGGGSFGGSG
jgi:hypothetical protein